MYNTLRRFGIGVLTLTLFSSGVFVSLPALAELSPTEERTALEQELAELEKQISNIEGDITKTQEEKKSLQNDIYILRQRINKLDLQISQSNVLIGDLKEQIGDTTESIGQTTENIAGIRDQLGDVLQRIYREDQKSTVEIVLGSNTLSDFFSNIAALEALDKRNEELLSNMVELNTYLENQKGELEEEKGEEENLVRIRILQKQESASTKYQTENLLDVTKGKESEYQKLLTEKQERAQEIRSRIFELVGVPDAPTFGEALAIAELVSSQTGVRPALLLAVLTQESNIGKNVGQCYLRNTTTGSGIGIRTGNTYQNVMKPMGKPGRKGDIDDFITITTELGRDPFQTPVSCPIPSIGGYGGA
ncbi:MAG: hypothetical protein QF775_01700, partial [archaeon]|nr:hypothetical protein [archaeon]